MVTQLRSSLLDPCPSAARVMVTQAPGLRRAMQLRLPLRMPRTRTHRVTNRRSNHRGNHSSSAPRPTRATTSCTCSAGSRGKKSPSPCPVCDLAG